MMRSLYVIVVCLALSACGAGIVPLEQRSNLPSPTLSCAPGSAKAYLNWNSIDLADGYRLFWAGPFDAAAGSVDITAEETQVMDFGADATSFEHQGLVNGGLYCYSIAGTLSGLPGDLSNVDCLVPMAVPPVTTSAGSLEVTISWDPVEGAASYKIYRSVVPLTPSLSKSMSKQVIDPACEGIETGDFVAEVTGTSVNDDNVSNCQDYCYTVVPVDVNGHELNESTQWVLAQPQVIGIPLDITFNTEGVGAFTDVIVLNYDPEDPFDDAMIVTQSGAGGQKVLKYSLTGGDPIWTTDLSGHDVSEIRAVTADSEGQSIFVAVSKTYLGNTLAAACKLDAETGVLDTGFGNNGCDSGQSFGGSLEAVDLTIDSNGRVLMVGHNTGEVEDVNLYIWRLEPDGALDLDSFGCADFFGNLFCLGYSIYVESHYPDSYAGAITTYVQGGQEVIVVVGNDISPEEGLVITLDQDGRVFEDEEHTKVIGIDDSSIDGQPQGVTVASDGSLLVTGIADPAPQGGLVARFDTDPLNFSDMAIYDGTSPIYGGYDIAVNCRGKPVVVGALDGNPKDMMGIWQLEDISNFALDHVVGDAGIIVLSSGGDNDLAIALDFDSVGRYVVVGVIGGDIPNTPIAFIIK